MVEDQADGSRLTLAEGPLCALPIREPLSCLGVLEGVAQPYRSRGGRVDTHTHIEAIG